MDEWLLITLKLKRKYAVKLTFPQMSRFLIGFNPKMYKHIFFRIIIKCSSSFHEEHHPESDFRLFHYFPLSMSNFDITCWFEGIYLHYISNYSYVYWAFNLRHFPTQMKTCEPPEGDQHYILLILRIMLLPFLSLHGLSF